MRSTAAIPRISDHKRSSNRSARENGPTFVVSELEAEKSLDWDNLAELCAELLLLSIEDELANKPEK